MNRSQQLQAVMTKARINTRRVSVLGDFAHIDTFHKYESRITDMMTAAGFRLVSSRDGAHLDGVDGFRLVYRVEA